MSEYPREARAAATAVTTDANAECDLVLKGGITSGVVYPAAIAALSAHYRLRSIGGASAGAIAAAAAAAAEVGRDSGGVQHPVAELLGQVAGNEVRVIGHVLAGLPGQVPLLRPVPGTIGEP